MRRVLAILAVALFLGQTTGLGEPVEPVEEECGESCPEHRPEGLCPPGCDACACCPAARLMLPAATEISAPAPTLQLAPPAREVIPPTPEPHEILHVPKLALASAGRPLFQD